MRHILAVTLILMLFPVQCMLSAQTSSGKPNIILIMVDDLGYGDLGCYGQRMFDTPNIDSMASKGIRFTDYYAGSTVCGPSRESILTGMHTGHTFIRGNFLTNEQEDPALPSNKLTIAEVLKEAGYYTGIIGKWGLGGQGKGPETQGFDYSYGYLDQINAHNYYPPFLYEDGKKINIQENIGGKKGAYSHYLFKDKTIDFIQANSKKPFFLYLPYTLPHGEHVIPDNSAYAIKDWPEKAKNYAAMVSLIDTTVKEILEELKKNNLDKNTVIIFTSDNGASPEFAQFFESNGKLRGAKRDLYEGGVRVPMLVYWPEKIKKGYVSDETIAAWDIFPTLSQIASAKVKGNVDGISFYSSLLAANPKKRHDYLYWEFYTYNYNWKESKNKLPRNYLTSKAVRMGPWKAVKLFTDSLQNQEIELYNLEIDIGEEKNVASDNPAIIKEMRRLFEMASVKEAPYFPYQLNVLDFKSKSTIKDFFKYSPIKKTMVSAHRGGSRPGFPENCIATFENTLLHTHAILEIDPRYTKDGHIVLMHDATLERTTNGSGKVADHTLLELKELRLKDSEDRLTDYQIPTLDEALEWAKDKTVLVIDEKDVPIEKRMLKIKEHNASSNAIVIAYSLEDIKKGYQLSQNIMMEVMMGNKANIEEFESSGVPWENVVAFVGHDLPTDPEIVDELHQKGVMCIQGSSRNLDKSHTLGDINSRTLNQGYRHIISSGIDIIETDLGIEVGSVLKELNN